MPSALLQVRLCLNRRSAKVCDRTGIPFWAGSKVIEIVTAFMRLLISLALFGPDRRQLSQGKGDGTVHRTKCGQHKNRTLCGSWGQLVLIRMLHCWVCENVTNRSLRWLSCGNMAMHPCSPQMPNRPLPEVTPQAYKLASRGTQCHTQAGSVRC